MKNVIFVGICLVIVLLIEEVVKKLGLYYVNICWVGGFLINWIIMIMCFEKLVCLDV